MARHTTGADVSGTTTFRLALGHLRVCHGFPECVLKASNRWLVLRSASPTKLTPSLLGRLLCVLYQHVCRGRIARTRLARDRVRGCAELPLSLQATRTQCSALGGHPQGGGSELHVSVVTC